MPEQASEITLEQVQAMLYVAKNPDEVEQMMYQSSVTKTIANIKKGSFSV